MVNSKKVLFIADALNVGANGAKTVTTNHMLILNNIYGKENVIVINLSGTDTTCSTAYVEKTVSSNPIIRGINLLMGYTGKINYHITKEILYQIEKNKFDIVFIDNSIYGKLVKKIKSYFLNIMIITYYADVKANLCKEWMQQDKKKIPVFLNLMRNEKLNQKYSDINLVLNMREKRAFFKCYRNMNSDILKIPVKTTSVLKNEKKLSKPLKILFLGAYYYPNVHGIEWFVEHVMPFIEQYAVLQISGNGMEILKDKYIANSKICVTGRVDNLEKAYLECDVVIGPIFEGAGMKVKTAEAFSFGKCYVGTSESLEGYYEDIPKELLEYYIFKADTAEEFIEVFGKIRNNVLIKKFNQEIYEFYIENYSEKAIERELTKIINKH